MQTEDCSQHIDEGIQPAYFMEVDTFNGNAMDSGFGFRQSLKNQSCSILHGRRGFARFHEGQKVAQMTSGWIGFFAGNIRPEGSYAVNGNDFGLYGSSESGFPQERVDFRGFKT